MTAPAASVIAGPVKVEVGGWKIELGTGRLRFPAGPGPLEFWVDVSMEQARMLRDALSEALDANSG